ncbi:MAG: hypothetical protein NC209_02980 [Alistipes sp.]|nr:hypothetical protein [Alistipes senegalensis]MCM1250093.1 hypothetical protein [Alistipes sp.]
MIRHFRSAVFAVVLLAVSCAEEQTESYGKFEDLSLEAWISQNRPELLDNYQDFGEAGYYIDVLDAGDPDAAPVSDTVCWVKFDFSGRDLASNIVLTRRAAEARLAGTFTNKTHYVPFYRYCGTSNTGLLEGTYLAMREVQTLGESYFEKYKDDSDRRLRSREVRLREGSRVVLYCPSRIVGEVSGDGGYEGQYSLSSGKPIRIELEILDTIKNPLAAEGGAVDAFCTGNGGLLRYTSEEEPAEGAVPMPTDPSDPNHPYRTDKRWVSVSDSIPQLYADFNYRPGDPLVFADPYVAKIEPYVSEASMADIDRRIDEALRKRFLDDDDANYPGAEQLAADSVDMEKKTKIWYITRFLDGFVIDTNIDEVKEIVFGEVKTPGTAYDVSQTGNSPIAAWHYALPKLKYGQWAALATVSTHAYGAQGRQGTTTTSTSSSSNGYTQSYYDYLNYMSYANSYYGSGYGGYYPGYYGGYYGGMYNPYYGYGYNYDYGYGGDTSDTETTTTTSSTDTEILPFTPLLFQIYIEPAE